MIPEIARVDIIIVECMGDRYNYVDVGSQMK